MNELNSVQKHYATEALKARFEQALQRAGLGTGLIEWPQLAAADQFHARGLQATKELAAALHPEENDSVLDVGCGFGGPARFLAATIGCHVTGIDLTPEYIEIAEMLTQRTGLTNRLTFVSGDGLELPFPDASFDHAWTQHVAMNIADKAKFYAGIYRVLKPGGRLAIYDFVKGGVEPVIYPMPWAREPAISFLATPEEMNRHLQAAGFRGIASPDQAAATAEWVAQMRASPASAPASGNSPPLNLAAIVLPSDGGEIVSNIIRNLAEDRVRLTQVIAQKD